MAETWIVYKAENMSAHGWEDRMLMPSEGLTDILHEEWWSDGDVPKVGDRLYDSKQDDDGTVYARDGDWVVSKIQSRSEAKTSRAVMQLHERTDTPQEHFPHVGSLESQEAIAAISQHMLSHTQAGLWAVAISDEERALLGQFETQLSQY